VVKPWPWADTWPEARITVKRIGASAIALAGSSGQALAFGPGHVERTADAGERGVAIYSARRDTHFRFLKDVAIGDEIDITRHDGKTFRYRADGSSIVRYDQSGIDPFTAGDVLAVRCDRARPDALRAACDDDFALDAGGTILAAVIATRRRRLAV
jgi:sortase A